MGENRRDGVRCSQMILESQRGSASQSYTHEDAPLLASPLHPAGGQQLSPSLQALPPTLPARLGSFRVSFQKLWFGDHTGSTRKESRAHPNCMDKGGHS